MPRGINKPRPEPWTPMQKALAALLGLGVIGLIIAALATAPDPAGAQNEEPRGNPAGPKFAPPYRPLDGKRDTFTIICNPNDPTGRTLVLTFQPWNDQNGWFGVEDVHGEHGFGPGDYPSGSSFILANRQGQKLTYWSGAAGDDEPQTIADHPGARDGVYTYNIVHGRCIDDAPPPTEPPPTSPPPTEPPPTSPPPTEPPPTSPPPTEPPPTTPPTTVPPETTTTLPVAPTTTAPGEPAPAIEHDVTEVLGSPVGPAASSNRRSGGLLAYSGWSGWHTAGLGLLALAIGGTLWQFGKARRRS